MKVFIIVALSIAISSAFGRTMRNLAKDETAAEYTASILVGGLFLSLYILALVFFCKLT